MKYRFRRWLRNWLNNFDSDGPEKATLTVRQSDDPDHNRCLNFKVWFANGGKVIQTMHYDRMKDESRSSMYVITEDQDLGSEIDKIITIQSLKQ
jgi:hypothetical protein